ncbi:10387_t:CDS:2, partial [Rhizophagus irregularis]
MSGSTVAGGDGTSSSDVMAIAGGSSGGNRLIVDSSNRLIVDSSNRLIVDSSNRLI